MSKADWVEQQQAKRQEREDKAAHRIMIILDDVPSDLL